MISSERGPNPEKPKPKTPTEDPLTTIAGGLAAKYLEERLKAGGDIEIPSLGITFKGESETQEEQSSNTE